MTALAMELPATPARRAAALLAAVGVLPAVVGAVLGWLAGGAVGLVVGFVLLGAAAAAAVWARAGQLVTTGLGGAPADPVEHARLSNLVDALCVSAGVSRPDLRVLPAAGLNLAVVARDRTRAALVVTSALVAHLSLIETEAVLAVAVAELRREDTLPAVLVAAAGGVGVERVLSPARDAAVDDAAVTLTRYPPGLSAAYAELAARGTEVPGVPRAQAHLWLADPRPSGAPAVGYRIPLEQRIAVLDER